MNFGADRRAGRPTSLEKDNTDHFQTVPPLLRFLLSLLNSDMSVAKTLQRVKQFIPPLSSEMYKGQAGRVGVIGGSEEKPSQSGVN